MVMRTKPSILLGTGGFGDIAINPLKSFQPFQADLNVKF